MSGYCAFATMNKDELRELSSRGGVASGKARRERRRMIEAISSENRLMILWHFERDVPGDATRRAGRTTLVREAAGLMSTSSQRKGRKGERELRDKLQEYGYEVRCGTRQHYQRHHDRYRQETYPTYMNANRLLV